METENPSSNVELARQVLTDLLPSYLNFIIQANFEFEKLRVESSTDFQSEDFTRKISDIQFFINHALNAGQNLINKLQDAYKSNNSVLIIVDTFIMTANDELKDLFSRVTSLYRPTDEDFKNTLNNVSTSLKKAHVVGRALIQVLNEDFRKKRLSQELAQAYEHVQKLSNDLQEAGEQIEFLTQQLAQKQETVEPETIRCKCGECGRFSQMKILSSYNHTVEYEDEKGNYLGDSDYVLRLLLCNKCDKINYSAEDSDGETWAIWPKKTKEAEEITQLKEQLSKEQKKHAAEIEHLNQQLQKPIQKSLTVVQTEIVEGEGLTAISIVPRHKQRRLKRMEELEGILSDLYSRLSGFDKLLGLANNPTEYSRLELEASTCKKEIKRIEKELVELEK